MQGKVDHKNAIIGIIALTAFFLLWEFSSRNNLIDSQFVPPFSTVALEAGVLLEDGSLFHHIGSSLGRLFSGLGLAVVTGIPLGFFLSGWTPGFSNFMKPLLNNFSMLNPFALIPVFITILGIGEISKIGIIYWVLVWPVTFSTTVGIQAIDPEVMLVARSMGAKRRDIFFHISIPAAIAPIFQGLKTSLTLGFIVLLSAEMVGAETGLGWLVFNSQKNYNIPRMYVGILLVAIIGFVISGLLDYMQKSIVDWNQEA
ncbi:MAG: ABC transporter permease [Clostridiales Family XIII bacterium]|jgi:NitT/TauT family transport system permease protein|nr:ABC transporter permease [Clostridiales Family XIII bacterium]